MPVDLDPEILRLRAALRDLVALFSVPAVWVDREPVAVAEGIADALVGLSQVDFAFVRLCDSAGAVEARRGNAWTDFPEWLEHHPLPGDQLPRAQIVPDVGCDGDRCCGLVIPIGVEAEGGLVAAASARADFPTEVDQLLLSLAANHAATAFQNARLIHDRKRTEDELRGARDELAREQAALRQVASLVARESSPRQLFAVVAEQVARIIDVPLVRLVRFEPERSAVELIGGWGESLDPLAIGTRWHLDGPGVLTSVWQSGRPARLDDYTDVPGQAAAVVRQAGMRSAIASPITVEGRLWGAIAVLSPRHEPLPENTEARLAGFTELLATAIADADSRLAIARLADEQAALRRVATLVAHESPPGQLFAAVAEEVGRVLTLPVTALVRYEPDGSAIEIVGAWSESTFPVPIGTRLLLDGPSVVASVRQTGRPARTDDSIDVPGEIAAAQRQAGLRSNIASPILVEGRLWGAMGAGSPERLPDDIESRLMEFTELVATAIANSEGRDDLRRLVDEQAALRRVATLVAEGASADEVLASVAREVAHVFDVRLATVCRYGSDAVAVLASLGVPEFPAGSRWPLDTPGLPATIYETGRPARIDDFSAAMGLDALAREGGVRAAVGVPIIVDGSVWGSINVASTEYEPFPPDAEERLARFTELVATAIANTEFRAGLRRLAGEQAALRRVATLVAEGASAKELFSAVAQEVAGVIGIPVVGVHRYEPDATFTMVGIAGDTSFTVGSRWPIEAEGLAGMILASGRPARKDDYSTMSGPLGAALRDDRMVSTVGVPIVVDGNIWGFMVAGGRPGEATPAGAEEHLVRFTELVATAVSNATIRADLIASRARVVAAADETRRRIERDLHDGAQQQLVTLALGMRTAEARVPAGLDDLKTEVRRFADRLTSVIDELREMSRGIHPAILTEGGLAPAVEALALRSAVPVKLDVRCECRLPEKIEVAGYYVISEALTNAAKHADASRVEIDLEVGEETLYLAIRDDGVGGADPTGGSGLIGLKDRVEALGGMIVVASPPGGGTRLDVEIPLLTDPFGSDPGLLSKV